MRLFSFLRSATRRLTLLPRSRSLLTDSLPKPLSVVLWVNSGSEANDLALRLARAHTRRRGVLVVGGAYHGHTGSMIDASPYKFERQGGTGLRCALAPPAGHSVADAASQVVRTPSACTGRLQRRARRLSRRRGDG